MVVEDGHPKVPDDPGPGDQDLVVWLGRRDGDQPVPAVDDAGERLAEGAGLQRDGVREEEDLLGRDLAVLGTAAVSEDATGVATASVLTEVDLASGAELTAVAGTVWINSNSVPGSELLGRHLPHLHDRPGELVTQRDLLLPAHRELALNGGQAMKQIEEIRQTHRHDVEVSPAETCVPHLDDDIVRGGDLRDGHTLQAELALLGVTLQGLHLTAIRAWLLVRVGDNVT